MTGRREFRGKEKEKTPLEFLCFLSVAKSIPSVFMLFPLLSSALFGRWFKVLYLVCECEVGDGRMSRQLAKFG